MKPLEPKDLRLEAENRTIVLDSNDGLSRTKHGLIVTLTVDRDDRLDLVSIILEDDESIAPGGRVPFHFWYTPIEVRWSGEQTEKLTYTKIDLVIYSTVRARVVRNNEAMLKLEAIGMDGVEIEPDVDDRLFSPFRPKITLRRVHRRGQVPRIGSKPDLKMSLPDYSAYIGDNNEVRFTTEATFNDWKQKVTEQERRTNPLAARTWARIVHSEDDTAFDFSQSGFRLQVYDQLFDSFDGRTVENYENPKDKGKQISVEDAIQQKHTAKEMIAQPRTFSYEFGFAPSHPGLGLNPYRGHTYQRESGDKLLIKFHLDQRNSVPMVGGGPTLKILMPALGFLVGDKQLSVNLYKNPDRHPPGLRYSHRPSLAQVFEEFTFAVTVGFTPVLGDCFDLYELYTAFWHGKDAFGNRLSDTEKIVTAVAVLIPAVGAGVLRRGVNTLPTQLLPDLTKFANEHRRTLTRLLSYLESQS